MEQPVFVPGGDALAEQLLWLCEVVATERPEVLAYLIETVRLSPSGSALMDLAGCWGVEMVAVRRAVEEGVRQLDRLEAVASWRGTWRGTKAVFGRSVNVAVLHDLAVTRKQRGRGGNISRVVRMLEREREHEEIRSRIESFLDVSEETRAEDLRLLSECRPW